MEIKVLSRETVKPSLPTPNEVKNFKLCLFDQFQLTAYFPIILFYPKNNDFQTAIDFSAQLKRSLSETLTIFYPLAGRRNDYFSVNCNDEGAPYFETLVNINMIEFLNPPKIEFLNKLLPCEANKLRQNSQALPQILVQVNIFSCGGIAIGLCNLHTLLDACSCSTFLKSWAAICRDSRDEICWPDFSSAFASFPPRNTLGMRSGVLKMNSGEKIEAKCTIRRYVFNAKVVNDLRVKAKVDESSINPTTRYQALSAFIYKHMVLACRAKSNEGARSAVVLHVVDMRRRMGEPFNEKTMGNLLWPAVMLCENVNVETEIKDLAKTMRENIGKLSMELFQRVQNDPKFIYGDECGELMLEGIEMKNSISFVFTSWGNMGFNEVNFGWGKPLWVGLRGGSQETVPNSVIFLETNEGVEAWVTMKEQHITILDNDVEFLRFAMVNPCV